MYKRHSAIDLLQSLKRLTTEFFFFFFTCTNPVRFVNENGGFMHTIDLFFF